MLHTGKSSLAGQGMVRQDVIRSTRHSNNSARNSPRALKLVGANVGMLPYSVAPLLPSSVAVAGVSSCSQQSACWRQDKQHKQLVAECANVTTGREQQVLLETAIPMDVQLHRLRALPSRGRELDRRNGQTMQHRSG